VDRPHPGRGGWRPAHAASDRRALGRRVSPPRGHDRVTVAEPLGVTEPDDPDPHGGSNDRNAECDRQRDTERDRDRRTDDSGSNGRAHDASTDGHTTADEHAARPDQNALGPAQLRNDRRELAHRVARHRDVADAQALAALEEQLA
jgi:hypothetical protein